MNNFLLGFGIGLTVAMLFAPRAGGETRQLIVDKVDDTADYLSQQAQQLKDSASDLVDRGRTILNDQKDKITSAANAYQRA